MARTEWQMSARELWTQTPVWEIELLLDERQRELKATEHGG